MDDPTSLSLHRRKILVLKVGDEVLISGVGFTGRAAAGLASVSWRR